jgi:hypothetical protein
VSDLRIDQATELVRQLRQDLDAIAAADPDSLARRRAITQYTSTYAALGRLRLQGT